MAYTPEERRAWYAATRAERKAYARVRRAARREQTREYDRAYREANTDRLRRQARDWAANNRDHVNTKARAYRVQHHAQRRAVEIKHRETHPEARMLACARDRARKRNMAFDITAADINPPTHCPVFGLKLKYGRGPLVPNSATLDRIDSKIGYLPGNVWVICHRANAIKNDGTPEEHEAIARAVRGRLAKSEAA